MTDVHALDPHSANVGFEYVKAGSDDDWCVGRRYYWYEPGQTGVWAWNDELRDQHPEISDVVWHKLFGAAYRRGELGFLKQFSGGQRHGHGEFLLILSYHFGPHRSIAIARDGPEFQYFLDLLDLGDERCRRPNKRSLIRSRSRITWRRMRVWWKSGITLVKETGR
jgi:hypothetical protein